MTSFHIGIDPGSSGGIAVLEGSGAVVLATAMPDTDRDLFELLQRWTLQAHAYLEHVHAMPKNGSQSAFKLGGSDGRIRMGLTAAQIPFDVVSPVKWQTAMQCRTKGDKNVSKRRAQELFPAQRVTHAVADALLIAEYGRRARLTPPAKAKARTLFGDSRP